MEIVRTSSVALLVIELGIVLLRSRNFNDKREPRFFSLILLVLCFKVLFPGLDHIRELSTLFLFFCVENHLSLTIRNSRLKINNMSMYAAGIMLAVMIPLEVYGSISYRLFYLFLCALFCVSSLVMALKLFAQVKRPIILIIVLLAVLLLGVSGVEQFISIFPDPSFFLGDCLMLAFIVALGYLLFQENYLAGAGFHGVAARLVQEEKRAQQVYFRLLSSEQSLIEQDRLISVGLLAGGLAHEFKNILSLISSCAQFGLETELIEKKQQSLELIRDHVEHSMNSVIRVLDHIRANKRVEPQEFELEGFLSHFIKMVKANYRTSDIEIYFTGCGTISVMTRKADLEQILFNLVRNAAGALLKRADSDSRRIWLVSSLSDRTVIVSVRDNAGGIPEKIALRLFELHADASASTGMGLYLTKMLAHQNGLDLSYSLDHGESCFTITLPLAQAKTT